MMIIDDPGYHPHPKRRRDFSFLVKILRARGVSDEQIAEFVERLRSDSKKDKMPKINGVEGFVIDDNV